MSENPDPPVEEKASEASEKKPNIIRRMYAWTLSWAEKPGATWALSFISFIESSFFPIPPDPLLMALCFSKPNRWWVFAFWCSVASVAGALLGYLIGFVFWDVFSPYFYAFIPGFNEEVFEKAKGFFEQYAFWAIAGAAFTPVPYKVFTVAAGVASLDLFTLITASIVGRSARFFLVAGVIGLLGDKVKPLIEKYLEVATVVLFIVGVLGFVAIKYLKHMS